jgi:uncharacterized protein YcaQ
MQQLLQIKLWISFRWECIYRYNIYSEIMKIKASTLKSLAISHTLFLPTTLSKAIHTLGFVQADPIRSPARAQDLILRQRVIDYKVGDLEESYAELELEEDFLYAYGFVTRTLQQYLHPRKLAPHSPLERKILRIAQQENYIDSKELEKIFGRKNVTNAWGGSSRAIKVALENLHYAGLLRVSRRDKGRRIYGVSKGYESTVMVDERLKRLVMAIVHILYPVSQRTLHEALLRTRQHIGDTKSTVEKLIKSGLLERHEVDTVKYIWPKGALEVVVPSSRKLVRFLAPFDPLVWDRRRFEHVWGWPYRFEAYTPPAKRIRGYYAMPLLWGEEIIGWANITAESGKLVTDIGYVHGQPKDPAFQKELQAENQRMEKFLKLAR